MAKHELIKCTNENKENCYLRIFENLDESYEPISFYWELVDINENPISKSDKIFTDREICVDNALNKNSIKIIG